MNIEKILLVGLVLSLLLVSACSKVATDTTDVSPEELPEEALESEAEDVVGEELIAEDDFVEIGDMI